MGTIGMNGNGYIFTYISYYMKDLRGEKNPFYGKKHSEETIKKMRKVKLGKKNARFGIKLSPEIKKKIGDAQRGNKNHMWGKHHTNEWKKKHSKRMSGKNNPMFGISINGENAHQWKGEFVSYEGLHIWVRKNKPKPDVCEMCNFFKPKQISNISGEYKRDIDDFQWLCASCHWIYDNQINDIIGVVSAERRIKYME
jgi:hypothetical protein